MRRCLLPALALLMFVARPAVAWGPEGHIITARIAELNLNEKARAQVKKILEDRSIADSRLANWADYIKRSAQYRDKYPSNSVWHYVDINVEKSVYEPDLKDKKYADVILKIDEFRKVLADDKAEAVDRKEALLFLVHLIGDMHQPLHCAERKGDRGGNLYSVRYKGEAIKQLNLHKVWDGHLVREVLEELEPLDRANRLNMAITPEERKSWEKHGAKEWALEAHQLAKDFVYKDVPEDKGNTTPAFDLDEKYVKRGKPVVADQLKRGGVRLAKVLNEILGQ